MKKKLLLFIFIVLFVITGCKKQEEDDSKKYECIKYGFEESISGMKWKQDIINTAKIDSSNKLVYYSSTYKYMYETKDDCDYWCDIKVKWNDEINSNRYSGGHGETKCNCKKKELTEIYIYDDIKNLAGILRSDIVDLKEDNTFDLDTWREKRLNNGYTCE